MKKAVLVLLITMIFHSVIYASSFESENQAKAYKEINFGDSEEVVKKKIFADPEIESLNNRLGKVNLGGHTFVLFFSYHNNQLYRIGFIGERVTAGSFETKIRKELDFLGKMFKKEYGNPSFFHTVTRANVYDEGNVLSHRWKGGRAGDKDIKILVCEKESLYYILFSIEYTPLLEKMEEEKSKEK